MATSERRLNEDTRGSSHGDDVHVTSSASKSIRKAQVPLENLHRIRQTVNVEATIWVDGFYPDTSSRAWLIENPQGPNFMRNFGRNEEIVLKFSDDKLMNVDMNDLFQLDGNLVRRKRVWMVAHLIINHFCSRDVIQK